MSDIDTEEYPRFGLIVNGEEVFVTRTEAQDLLFLRDGTKISGRAIMSQDHFVTLTRKDAEAEIYGTSGIKQATGE